MGKEAKHIGDSLFAGDVSPASLQRPITRPVLAWLGTSLTLGPTLASLSSDKTAKALLTASAKCTPQFSLYLPPVHHLTLSQCIRCQLPPGLRCQPSSVLRLVSHWLTTGQCPASAQPRISGISSLGLATAHLISPILATTTSHVLLWSSLTLSLTLGNNNNHYRENIPWRLVSFKRRCTESWSK